MIAVRELGRLGVMLVTAALAGAALAETPPVPAAIEQAARTYITRAALEAPIRYLSSDLLEGRGPGTRADQLTRLYLETRLEGLGYQSAFAGGAWQQPFDMISIKGQFPKSWSFQGKKDRIDLAWREDYIASSGLQSQSVSVDNAELVFVGYGVQAPEFHWDDFKGVNLAGKILVIMNHNPEVFAGKRRRCSLRAATISTSCAPRRPGAISSRCRSASAPRSPSPTRCRVCRPPTSAACCPGAIRGSPRSWWCCRRTMIILASASRMPAAIGSTTARSTTPPAARRCSPSPARSRRCPSGRAARCWRYSSPPRSAGCSARSTPSSCPPAASAADINIDGGNIFGRTRDATLVSMGKSSLDDIAVGVSRAQGRVVNPDQFPDRGYYYRSDQFSFAKVGVPALFFDDGMDYVGRPPEWGRQQREEWELKKYHQPGDKLDDTWNFDGMIEDAQRDMLAAWLIAQADAMPTWKPGDEFEAARKRALAALGGNSAVHN